MKTKTLSLVLIPLLAYFSAAPTSQAVMPPPDGGYPGGNTAEGDNALLALTTGTYNTAVGWFSLQSNLIGNFNTAIGAGTLFTNTADANTAVGVGALLNNTTGASNTAAGVFALFDNTTGGSNTATGFGALGNNTSGNSNTAAGFNALLNNTSGNFNTAAGVNALLNNTIANNNTAIGYQALLTNTTGLGNTAIGFRALQSSTDGDANTAIGGNALSNNTTGGGNAAFGGGTLLNNTSGDSNTAIGVGALSFNTTGNENVALGEGAGGNVTTANNVICIGSDGANVNNSCFIGNIRGVTTAQMDAVAVFVDSDGQLGTVSSSRRYKTDIQTMSKDSQAILALKPVTFHYKSDSTKVAQFGLIAEEVAEINPDLVVRDKNGEIYTVRYDAVNAMLLNEFLKEHRKVQEQEATIAQLRKDLQVNATRQQQQIDALSAGLQKVSAQLELHQSPSQTVLNDR